MNFGMDFQFAGPTNLPYVRGPNPVPVSPHIKAVDPAFGLDCQACLRTAIGCGSAPSLDELNQCQAATEGIQAMLHKDCTLQERLYSPFPVAMAEECAHACALNPELQYGSGFTRPFVDTAGPGSVTM